MWNRNDSATYHPKLGIDPTGWIITRPGASPPDNCPPDGASVCPDPYIGDDHGFPDTIIWSAELTQGAYVWGKGSMTAEAVNATISVWTYAAPEPEIAKSTYWDNGSLVQTPFPDDKLPDPVSWISSGFVTGVRSEVIGNDLIIEWNTIAPASTQLTYTVSHKVYTPTAEMTHTVFSPLIFNPYKPSTPSLLDTTPVTQHKVILNGLLDGDTVTFIPMSRRPLNNTCITEVGDPYMVTVNFP